MTAPRTKRWGDDELLVEDKGDQEMVDAEVPSEGLGPEMEDIAPSTSMSGETGTYVLGKGETLMQAAFKIYGDYRKWKYLMDMNNLGSRGASEGASLKYEKPANKFVWNPRGEPYLIRRGTRWDTFHNKSITPQKDGETSTTTTGRSFGIRI